MTVVTYTGNTDKHEGTSELHLRGGSLVVKRGVPVDLTDQEIASLSGRYIFAVGGAAGAMPQWADVVADENGNFAREVPGGGLVPLTSSGLGNKTDAVGKLLPSSLPPLTPVGSVRRMYVHNDLRNPRGVGLNGWSKTDPVGSSGSTMTAITGDADFGNAVQVSFTHDGSAGRFVVITLNDTSATYGVPCFKDQIVFARANVKIAAQPDTSDVPMDLSIVFKNATPTQLGNRVVQHKNRKDGAITTLEGFDFAPGTAPVWVQGALTLSLPAVAGVYTFVVGQPIMVVDPTTDVPVYGDGSLLNWSWSGTADQSYSEGWVAYPAGIPNFGFHDNTQASTHAPAVITAAEGVALHQEAGATCVRLGLASADADLVWPSVSSPINWRAITIAPYLDALRAAGLKACFVGGVPTSWMTGGGNLLKDVPPDQYANLTALYNALLTTWPDVIVALEWWNEPNLNGSWGATPDAAKYVDTLKGVYPALHAAFPGTLILGGSLARYIGTDATGTDTATFLAAMYTAGAKGNMDRVSVHPYGADASTAAPTSSHTGNNNGTDEIMLAVREQKRIAGDSATKIWVTEYGANTTSATFNERQQAQMLLLFRGICRRAGDIDGFNVHSLVSDTFTGSTVRGYGVLEYQTLRRKPAWDALRLGHISGGSWRPLALLNSWTWYAATGSGDPFPAYAKDPLTNIVRFRGTVKGGATATSVIATLPSGHQPAIYRDFAATQSSAAVGSISSTATEPALCRVTAGVGGGLVPVANTSTTYFAFAGEFLAER